MEGDLVNKHYHERDLFWRKILADRDIIGPEFPLNPELIADQVAFRIGVLEEMLEGRLENTCQKSD